MLPQVPSSSDCDTLTCLTVANKYVGKQEVVDVAICWNYLVVADSQGITKYGLVNNKPGLERLDNPPGCRGIRQVSATPRYILTVTEEGQVWTNEEGKGWRRIVVQTTEEGKEEEVEDKEDVKEEVEDVEEVEFLSTACGDAHNLALDRAGLAYSLPSQLRLSGQHGLSCPRVKQVRTWED